MAKTAALSSEEVTIWRSWLLGYEYVMSTLELDLSAYDLDTSQLRVLMLLSEAEDNRMRMFDVSRATHRSPSRLSHMVARMEPKDLVVRLPCENDRRGAWLKLTDTGAKVLQQVELPYASVVHRAFIDAVGPRDLAVIGRAMRRIIDVNVDSRFKRAMARYEWWPHLD